jgi:hypothetical protein
MTASEILQEACKAYAIKIVSVNGNRFQLQDGFEVEVESNGMYKLMDDGYTVGPFQDVNALCRFILT